MRQQAEAEKNAVMDPATGSDRLDAAAAPIRAVWPAGRWLACGLSVLAAASTGCMLGTVPQGAMLGIGASGDDPATELLAIPRRSPFGDSAAGSGCRPEPRTIPLDLTVLGFDVAAGGDPAGIEHELWAIADEQAVEPHTRRRLADNGLRAGLVPAPLPPRLEQEISSLIVTPDGSPDTGSGLPAVRRTLRLLPGRESRLVARTDLERVVVFENRDEGLCGRTFQAASTAIDLRAWPAADGRVRLRAVPAIRHGPQRRDWVGDDGAFRLETGQASCLFEALAVDLQVPEGMLLLMGCSSPVTNGSVGDAIFNDTLRTQDASAPGPPPGQAVRMAAGSRKAFLIRPLSRPVDPMFDTPALR